jgi:predicted metalloprotease with PDZ domain
VLRDLYERHPLDSGGFTTEHMLESLERLSGAPFEDFFAAYVTGTEPLDLESAFATAGVELRPDERPEGSYLGLSASGGAVRSVRADGPAFGAGVQVADVITEVDGEPLDGSLDDLLEKLEPGTVLSLTLERRGEPRTLEVTTAEAPVGRWSLGLVESPTALQRAAYESWLGQAWPEPELPPEDPPVPTDP